MERNEIIEWIIIIAGVIGWWPKIFMGFDAPWYNVLIYAVYPLALIVIFVLRWRRVHEGFEYSRKIVDAQHQATGANIVGRPPETGGRPSPYPGVVIPDDPHLPKTPRDEDEDSE